MQDIEKGIRVNNSEIISFDNKKKAFIASITEIVQTAIKNDLLCGKKLTGEAFEKWHCGLCNLIINLDLNNDVLKEGSSLHYGQAQKWVNMTIKYMLVMGLWDDQLNDNLRLYHVPLDSYVFDAAKKELKIDKRINEWSRINEDKYKEYQREIREKVDCPIKWEWDAWIKQANQKE